jgi:hypothetical protein
VRALGFAALIGALRGVRPAKSAAHESSPNRKAFYVFCAYVGILLTSSSGVAADVFERWTVFSPAQWNKELVRCERETQLMWTVTIGADGHVNLALTDRHREIEAAETRLSRFQLPGKGYGVSPRFVHEVHNGTLIGYSRGEWGGAVWWFSRDEKSRIEISRTMVEGFFVRDSMIYAFEGGNRIGRRHGNLVRYVVSSDGKWSEERVGRLPDTPHAFTWIGPREALLISGRHLIQVNLEGQYTVLYSSTHGFGKAHSLARDAEGIVYVGAGRTIIRLTPHRESFREQRLVRNVELEACACEMANHRLQLSPTQTIACVDDSVTGRP